MSFSAHGLPVRQIIRVGIGVVEKAAMLDDQPARVGTIPAGVPPDRPLAGELLDGADRERDVFALRVLIHRLVAEPAPAVTRDLVATRNHRGHRFGVALHRHGDAEYGHRQPASFEQAQQSPHARTTPILVERLHAHVAFACIRLGSDDLAQERLRRRITVEYGTLRALFVIEHDLQREPRTAGPARIGRIRSVADEISWIVGTHARCDWIQLRYSIGNILHFKRFDQMSTAAVMDTEVPSGLVNLAEDALGAEVLWVTDDFFAAKERMLSRAEPVSRPGTFDAHGQWMDGWESRRRRDGGHDAAIIRLGLRGVIRLIDLDSRYFTGNFPPQASVEVSDDADALKSEARWNTLLPKSALQGNRHNLFQIDNGDSWKFLRVHIFPDGGIARLRVWGEVRPDWRQIGTHRIDLLAVENGGVGLIANDQHYGQIGNLNRPGRGINMGDGWETRRRREPGHDWAIMRLGRPGTIEEVEVDTAHFRGNFPDRVSLQAALIDNVATEALEAASAAWPFLLPEQRMRADHQHRFRSELAALGPVSHVRLNLHPDGGVSRLRLFGTVARS